MATKLQIDTTLSPAGPAAQSLTSVHPALTHLLDTLPDGIVLLDPQWRITYANDTARHISRIRPEHLHSQTHWELYPETLGTPVEAVYREVMSSRREATLDAFFYPPFQVWFSIRVLPADDGIALCYRDVTSIHEAEDARSTASAQLEQVLAATTDGVVTIDRDYCITYLNDRAAEILAPSGNVLNTNLWETFPDAFYPGSPFVEHYDRALNQRIPGSFEAFYPEPLNAWLDIIVRPSPSGFICFFRDITEQRLREQALHESEARYRVLTELSPVSQWSANAQGLVLYANLRFLEYIGKDFVPRTGTEYIACFDPRDRDRVLQTWTESVLTGNDYLIDARLLRAADGASRWWQLRALPVRDEAGVIQQWLGTATDIHEARTAADTLRAQYDEIDRQRRELETIYLGSPIGMALYEPKELRLLRINDRQAEIFRLPADVALGKSYDELAAGVPAAHALIRRAAAGEAILNHDLEGSLDRLPGEYRFWNINYSPIFAQDGSVLAVASATVEITHQKRAEAALIQSEKLAAVGRMASSIAHEINNPLESVTNLIYIARSYSVIPEVQHLLDLADQELRRVSIITNQTLRFHKQSTLPRDISCTDLYSTVLSLYEGRLRNSVISVEKRKRATRPISCFEGDIRQVLNNLVGNAIDAMPTGGRLLLRSREATGWRTGSQSTSPRKGIVLTVADTGIGISPQTRTHLFEAFFTTKGMKGTGLGLWISAEIVARHHGYIICRSSQRPGHTGSIFSIFLPFDSNLPAPSPPVSSPPPTRPN